jgi:hypothetical protein
MVSADASGRLFDRLAGPDGLTEHASTFTRPEVLVALGIGLAGAGRNELEALADRFLAERAVSVVVDRPWRSAAGPPLSCWPWSSGGDQCHRSDRRANRRGVP